MGLETEVDFASPHGLVLVSDADTKVSLDEDLVEGASPGVSFDEAIVSGYEALVCRHEGERSPDVGVVSVDEQVVSEYEEPVAPYERLVAGDEPGLQDRPPGPVNDPKRPPERTASIDLLRGIVMVVMALDHTRDYFGQTPFEPTDLDKTTPALFFTRWITHFCAPTFVFLAGTAAWLSRAKKSDAELTAFLLKRGVWLLFLEIVINNFCWSFDVTYSFTVLQVIWAIGWSMIFLALLVRLSPRAIAALGLAIVLLHNALDHVHLGAKTPWHPLWAMVHEQDMGLSLGTRHYGIFYPLVPWVGVMALGYALGSLYRGADGVARPREERARILVRVGLGVTIGFVLVRALNVYGDPEPWAPRGSFVGTLMSFLDCQKYPPSLSYLAMTLGPAVLLLGLFDRVVVGAPKGMAGVFVVYGRVPLFYYVLHILLIHAASEVVYSLEVGKVTIVRQWFGPQALNVGLPLTYVTWILAVASLYPLCLWFSRLKASPWGKERAWLSYL